MKKHFLALFLLILVHNNLYAARGNVYVGINATRYNWHVKQRMILDPNKVADPDAVNIDNRAKRQQFTFGELLFGIRGHNGKVYGATEIWLTPWKTDIKTNSNNIRFRTRLKTRYGGRIKFGVEDKNWVIYGLLGLGRVRTSTRTRFPNQGVYGALPGPRLRNNSFGKLRLMREVGIGTNYTFNKVFMVNIEYIHNKADVSSQTSESIITFLNPIGTQRSIVTSDTLQIGFKYLFLPFIF